MSSIFSEYKFRLKLQEREVIGLTSLTQKSIHITPIKEQTNCDISHFFFLNFFFIVLIMMLMTITIAKIAYKKATSFQEETHPMFQKTILIIAITINAITIFLLSFFTQNTSLHIKFKFVLLLRL